MPQTSLGLRHGPMAALDRDTDLVCFLSSERTRFPYEADLLREIQAKEDHCNLRRRWVAIV